MSTARDVAQALADAIGTVPGLRSWAYLPDTFQPPGVVVGQPDLAYEGVQRSFCTALWSFPLHLVVARTQDRTAQESLFTFLDAVVKAIDEDSTLGGVAQMARVTRATPTTQSTSAGELPGYTVNVDVLA